jgi:hypothetical protein
MPSAGIGSQTYSEAPIGHGHSENGRVCGQYDAMDGDDGAIAVQSEVGEIFALEERAVLLVGCHAVKVVYAYMVVVCIDAGI